MALCTLFSVIQVSRSPKIPKIRKDSISNLLSTDILTVAAKLRVLVHIPSELCACAPLCKAHKKVSFKLIWYLWDSGDLDN